MKRGLSDYVRAFVTAAQMTARGEKPASLLAEEAGEPLLAWCRSLVTGVRAVEAALATGSVTAREIVLHVEGRDVSLEKALQAVSFHAAQEFPSIVRQGGPYTLLALQASAMNDRFLLRRFIAHEPLTESVRQSLITLEEMLGSLPG
jgi:hypothetical protein